jgi:uncharacterized RDD family membrane protein YckC
MASRYSNPRMSDPGTTATEMGRTLPAPAASTDKSRLQDRRLAHFQLVKPIGEGGMGEVWLATDLALDRPVAIKLLSWELSSDGALRERFYREARAQARIMHPNIGHIYYIGEEDGQLFFAMELIEGESLAERQRRLGKLPADEALALCRQAALGLREAHRHGFTHRDVKPSNLMLDRHGAIKLVDFGLVKQQREGNVALTLETGGGVMGTPLYMAPEQARGDVVDFRTDIYALGATLHHLVTGAPPFTGKTPMQVVSRHLSEQRPQLDEALRKQNRALDRLLDRMMAKDPAQRFASYDDLLAAIDQAAPALTRPAGVFVRGAALMLDFAFVMGCVFLPLSPLIHHPWTEICFAVAWLLYATVAVSRFGTTVGKRLMEIEVVREARPGWPSWGEAAVRFLAAWGIYCLGFIGMTALPDQIKAYAPPVRATIVMGTFFLMQLPILVGAIAAAFRADRRAYWDRLAGTRVRYRARA